jgi:diacylglycerol kinase
MKKIIRSFAYAIAGIYRLIRDERNAKIHLTATIIAIGAGIYVNLQPMEWIFILLAIALVFITEAINTAIEETVDYLTLERKPQLKKIKDVAAGAVLMAAIYALVTAAIVFIPHFT